MTVERMAIVLHHSTLKGTAKLVLLGIANHDGDGGAWPTIETLATYANTSERSVQRALKDAEQAGELQVHANDGGTHHTRPDRRPNRYVITVECPPGCDGTVNHRHTQRGDATVTPQGERGDTSVANGVTPVSPEPSLQPDTPQIAPQGGPTIIEPANPKTLDRISLFYEFEEIYPRKEGFHGRSPIHRVWTRLLDEGHDPQTILEGARRYRDDPNREDQFTKSAVRWLRGHHWRDEPLPGPHGKSPPTPTPSRFTPDVLNLPTNPTPMPPNLKRFTGANT